MVSSGSDCMAFFWKGDQLFTRRGAVPSPDEWTTFYLSLREPMDIPDIKAFGKFIATSLAFTRNVRQVTVKVGATEILSFHKKVAEPR